MKFGKSLNNQIVETLPEWRDKFLSYKNLKKRLKQIGAGAAGGERRSKRQRVGDGGGSPPAMTAEESGFVALLDAELDKFNAFFLEKEEEYVIRQKVICWTATDSIDPILLISFSFLLREHRSDFVWRVGLMRGCRSCRTGR